MALTDKIIIPRRSMVLFFLIDTSGSMDGSKIGAVNSAIEEVIPAIKDISDNNADAQIKIAVMEFSSGARWITANGPVEADKFNWKDLNASGVTHFGAACKTLNEKLSTKEFMNETTGSYAPAIFLLSDGEPTDDNWKSELNILKQNNWFKAAVKVSIAIGSEANKDVLKEFTGSMEAVLEIHNAAVLMKAIKFVSIRASQIASKSSHASEEGKDLGDDQKQEDLIASLKEFIGDVALTPDNDQLDW